jgi:hypothetical protein
MLILVLSTIGTAVLATTISASHQSTRDRSVKRAIAAADSGLQTALYRMNKVEPQDLECVVSGTVSGVTTLAIEPVQADGWCREQTEDLGEGASYSYRVKGGVQVNVNGQNLLQRRIVSAGIVGGVQRRALTVVATQQGSGLFSGKGLISDKDLFMENNVVVTGDTGSNGVIGIKNNVLICGNATPGPGKQVMTQNNSSVCGSTTPATQPFVLNPVGTIPAVDGNFRIGTLDPWSSQGGSTWNPLTKQLTLQNNASLTLTGNAYSFCSLTLKNNSQLIIGARPPGAEPVKIYIQSPESCQATGGNGSVTLQNNASILNINSDPTTFQLYVTGSPTTSTFVDFKNNFTPKVNMAIYAPYSLVTLENNTDLVGAIAAGQVFLQNNSKVTADSRTGGIGSAATSLLYRRQSWVECTTSSGATPDGGC